jgi:hypothetical protein
VASHPIGERVQAWQQLPVSSIVDGWMADTGCVETHRIVPRRLMRDLACCADGRAASSTPSDLVRFNHTFRLTEGRHEWVIWRHYPNEAAPQLFK